MTLTQFDEDEPAIQQIVEIDQANGPLAESELATSPLVEIEIDATKRLTRAKSANEAKPNRLELKKAKSSRKRQRSVESKTTESIETKFIRPSHPRRLRGQKAESILPSPLTLCQ